MLAIGIQNIMAFRNLIVVALNLSCFFAVGCSARDVQFPAGPIEISYTSVRGASPRVVDYFVIVSANDPSVTKPDSAREGIDCFVVPVSVEPIFKRKLAEILAKHDWSKLASLPPKSADEPFRRLLVKAADGTSYVEIHEKSPADEFLNDAQFKRFYAVVSDVRLLGETFGVRSRIGGVPVAENLGVPLEPHK